jgi:hypothetical protein
MHYLTCPTVLDTTDLTSGIDGINFHEGSYDDDINSLLGGTKLKYTLKMECSLLIFVFKEVIEIRGGFCKIIFLGQIFANLICGPNF